MNSHSQETANQLARTAGISSGRDRWVPLFTSGRDGMIWVLEKAEKGVTSVVWPLPTVIIP